MAKWKSTADRFWSYVHKTDSCWLWRGHIENGYGRLCFNRKDTRAHRVAWTLTHGNIPGGLLVLHKCDVRLCVRPDHLFLGTTRDNVNDAISKHRHTRGEMHGNHKLTADDVRFIRASTESNRSLATRFGVHITRIGHIRARKSWRHVA